ncbi:hypothetical protein PanWU01x14_206970 [Parasponia andersonii]|uniref:Uncharacterized protein n=1 Tax=Parasponia andersonii TaxID=3476 RepID=A0A2P5BVD6_PARAD|nr:hypothetical protein PanWU01x14_206970 [Parasponia andersonii]
MNLMPRMVSYLPFPLDTWVITKHLRSRLDASTLNRFRRDEADRITVVSRQVAASSQLASTNDLVVPSNLELEEAVRLVATECVRLREEESAAPKRVKGSETGPSAGTSPIKGKVVASRAQAKTPAGRRLAVHTKGTESVVPRPDAGGSPAVGPLAFLVSRGETMATPGPTEGSAAVISPIPDSGSKSSAASLGGEIADLSGGVPRLKSRLSSPLPVPQNGNARSVQQMRKRTLQPARRRCASPPVLDGTGPSFVPCAPAPEACPADGGGIPMTAEEGLRSPGVSTAQRGDPATDPELDALTPENVELVTTRTLAQLSAIRSFHSDRVKGQTSEPRVIQPSPEALLGEGFGTVVVSSDESNPATPLFPEAGPSTGVGCPSSDGEFDPRVWLDFSDPKWDRARNQLQGLVDHCLDPSLQRRRPGLGSYREQTGHYHADVSLRGIIHRLLISILAFILDFSLDYFQRLIFFVCPQCIIRTISRVVDGRCGSQSSSNFEVCWQVLALRSSSPFARFSWVVDERRESQSESNFEVCWQVLALHSSSLFAHFLGSSTSDVSPRVRAISRSASKFWLCAAVRSSHVFLGSSTSDVSPRVRAISRSAGKFWLCAAVHPSHIFLGSSTSDVSPRVRAFLRSGGKFLLCAAVRSSHVFLGSSTSDGSPRVALRSRSLFVCC